MSFMQANFYKSVLTFTNDRDVLPVLRVFSEKRSLLHNSPSLVDWIRWVQLNKSVELNHAGRAERTKALMCINEGEEAVTKLQ